MAEIGRAYRKKSMLLQCVSTLHLFVPIFLRPRCLRKALTKIRESKAPRTDLPVLESLGLYLEIKKVESGQCLGIHSLWQQSKLIICV